MACTHGLENNNCPICRMVRSTIPKTILGLQKSFNNPLKPYFNKDDRTKAIESEIIANKNLPKAVVGPNSMNMIPEMKSPNSLSQFESKMFLERLRELDLSKIDIHKISKKNELISPELKTDKE
ncbi:MAG: hypothetical protein ACFFAS_19085 [Promethearchaeota archaeon]